MSSIVTDVNASSSTQPSVSTVGELITDRSIIVCCGSGGVGKTTVAAAIGVEGARRGKRTCVVTVDPARRLANALGLDNLPNQPALIKGDWPGELGALMLDPKTTFDDLVMRYAADPDQAEGILSNRLYRNLSDALSGTHEYMAMEKLYELHEDDRFELIVVDTPPTRNALDFIDAPKRLTRFLENRFFRVLMMPTRAYLKAVSVATQSFLRTISRVVGSEVVDDAVAFFKAFEGMEQGFRERANRVLELLGEPSTAFVLVASPRADAVTQAVFFAEELAESAIPVQALIVNRMHPTFGTDSRQNSDCASNSGHLPPELEVFVRNLSDFAAVAAREEENLAQLRERVNPAPVARVPFLADDVHDLQGLEL